MSGDYCTALCLNWKKRGELGLEATVQRISCSCLSFPPESWKVPLDISQQVAILRSLYAGVISPDVGNVGRFRAKISPEVLDGVASRTVPGSVEMFLVTSTDVEYIRLAGGREDRN